MALTICKECKQSISSKADTCPHCGNKLKSKSNGCLYSIVAFVLVLGFFYIISPSDTTTDYDNPTSLDALRFAQENVKKLLKSPSTAEFPDYKEKIDHVTGYYPEFKISSWVDSKNSFNATIRTYYDCEVYYTDDNKVGVRNLEIKK